MEHFYIYSFTLAVIPLLLGLLFIWFGKRLWDNATKKNEEYQQRYTGRTTLRVIKVEKNEWEETNSNEQGPESRISVTSYTPVYEYTVNGQQYENIIPAWEVLQINILLEKNVLDIIIQKIQQM